MIANRAQVFHIGRLTMLFLCAPATRAALASAPTPFSGHVNLASVGSTTVGAKFTGLTPSDNTGISVSAAGDINHDGIGDVLIGAYNAVNFNRVGKTFLIDGRLPPNAPTGTISLSTVGSSTLGSQFTGGRNNLASGVSTSAAGDFNGDGVDDLLIGTIDSESYIVYGKAGGLPGAISLNDVGGSQPGATFKVTDPNFFSSHVVAGAGDVNGDGIDDILIGTGFTQRQANDFVGRAYLIYGRPTASQYTGVIDLQNIGGSIPGAIFTGAQLGDEFGQAVSSAGDVNGDGLSDFLVGAYQDFVPESKPGKAYLVYGRTGVNALSGSIGANQIGTSVQGAVFTGAHTNSAFGQSVSAGDFNGDGLDDLLVGAYAASPVNGTGAGEAYVVFGKPTANQLSGAIAASSVGISIPGLHIPSTGDIRHLGRSVSGTGDFNGDGFDDILLGAPYSVANGVEGGQAFVIYGRADLGNGGVNLANIGTSTLPGVVFDGAEASDGAGFSVAWSGDLNGDGIADLVIGAPGATDAGSAYVIYGIQAVPEPSSMSLLLFLLGATYGRRRAS